MRHLLTFQYIDAITRAGSIRKAAENLAITPSALNRRLLSIEDELGVEIFERVPNGVVLNVAGEILLEHIRNQISDMERVRSRIADLSGERRGSVSIVCTEEAIGSFLSHEVLRYRAEHPGVTFKLDRQPRDAFSHALADHTSDIAVLFEPKNIADLQVLHTTMQPIVAVMDVKHPLARKRSVRLYECLEHAVLLPAPSSGVRYMLENAVTRLGLNFMAGVQSNDQEFLWHQMKAENHLSFRIPLNVPADLKALGFLVRPIDTRDVPEGNLFVGQLRGRALPVASARFMEQIISAIAKKFD